MSNELVGTRTPDARKSASADRDLRIAVVMTGGVSLCIWMGGVALELDYLRREVGLYGDLLQSARARPIVDIIAGTSAGGLNGTLLASAIAGKTDLTGLGKIWFELADFQRLLQPIGARDPNSVLQGEDVFRPDIEKVLEKLLQGAGADPPQDSDPRLHLIVTTTTTKPLDAPYVDEQNTPFSEPTFQGLFHFVRGPDIDHFADARAAEALARAARSSASFPGAFEPSYVPVGRSSRTDPDMAPYVNFEGNSRYTLDGGLVDNDPLDVVLDAISSQPATEVVDRTILFVNPLGALTKAPSSTPEDDAPRIFTVLRDTLLIPRQHSNVLLYNKLRLRGGQSAKLQQFRSDLFTGVTTPAMAAGLSSTAKRIAPTVTAHRSRLRIRRSDESTPETNEARQSLLIVQDLLQRFIRVSGDADLREQRRTITQALSQRAPTTLPLPTPIADATPFSTLPDLVAAAMTSLNSKLDSLDGLDSPVFDQLRLEIRGIRLMAESQAGAVDRAVTSQDWFQALSDLGVLQSAVTDGDVHSSQRIGFIEVSAATTDTSNIDPSQTEQPNIDTDPSKPDPASFDVSTKLTGVQLAHFGAFYAESWRRNDWIWGRLDGSYRLIAMLTDPEFLLELGDPGYVSSLLLPRLGDSINANSLMQALALVAETSAGKDRDNAVAAFRTMVVRPIWEERRIAILREEIPGLLESIERDIRAGLATTPALTAYMKSSGKLAKDPSDDEVQKAWTDCPVSAQRLGNQIRSARLIRQATQAGAVGVDTFETAIIWRLGRWPLKPIYWTLRACNALAGLLSALGGLLPRRTRKP